jgi:hypothetical protein
MMTLEDKKMTFITSTFLMIDLLSLLYFFVTGDIRMFVWSGGLTIFLGLVWVIYSLLGNSN